MTVLVIGTDLVCMYVVSGQALPPEIVRCLACTAWKVEVRMMITMMMTMMMLTMVVPWCRCFRSVSGSVTVAFIETQPMAGPRMMLRMLTKKSRKHLLY